MPCAISPAPPASNTLLVPEPNKINANRSCFSVRSLVKQASGRISTWRFVTCLLGSSTGEGRTG
jgi:hypothetical protein